MPAARWQGVVSIRHFFANGDAIAIAMASTACVFAIASLRSNKELGIKSQKDLKARGEGPVPFFLGKRGVFGR
jgi:hypothetical protein